MGDVIGPERLKEKREQKEDSWFRRVLEWAASKIGEFVIIIKRTGEIIGGTLLNTQNGKLNIKERRTGKVLSIDPDDVKEYD